MSKTNRQAIDEKGAAGLVGYKLYSTNCAVCAYSKQSIVGCNSKCEQGMIEWLDSPVSETLEDIIADMERVANSNGLTRAYFGEGYKPGSKGGISDMLMDLAERIKNANEG